MAGMPVPFLGVGEWRIERKHATKGKQPMRTTCPIENLAVFIALTFETLVIWRRRASIQCQRFTR